MQKYSRFPFLFFFLAACVGLLLRWHFISPISWLKFPYWLHAHSHIMFLGWVFNLLSLAFIHTHIEEHQRKKYKNFFMIIQVLLLGMLISFPLQGYGIYSIAISTLHTGVVGVFSFWFFRDTNNKIFSPSRWFARTSLVFFLVSALGPFSIGPLMVNGLAQTNWYYFAVYYYLHFQYNGVFIFGVFSLFFEMLGRRGIEVDSILIRRFSLLLVIACIPAYFLSILWAEPGWLFNVISFIASLIQLAAFIYFLKILRPLYYSLRKKFSFPVIILLTASLTSFTLKLVLQALSAHPYFAKLAYQTRNYVMAYLHLVLLGLISTFLLAWIIDIGWIKKVSRVSLIVFFIGFVGMEVMLISNRSIGVSAELLIIFSLSIVISISDFLYRSFGRQSLVNHQQ